MAAEAARVVGDAEHLARVLVRDLRRGIGGIGFERIVGRGRGRIRDRVGVGARARAADDARAVARGDREGDRDLVLARARPRLDRGPYLVRGVDRAVAVRGGERDDAQGGRGETRGGRGARDRDPPRRQRRAARPRRERPRGEQQERQGRGGGADEQALAPGGRPVLRPPRALRLGGEERAVVVGRRGRPRGPRGEGLQRRAHLARELHQHQQREHADREPLRVVHREPDARERGRRRRRDARRFATTRASRPKAVRDAVRLMICGRRCAVCARVRPTVRRSTPVAVKADSPIRRFAPGIATGAFSRGDRRSQPTDAEREQNRESRQQKSARSG